MSFVVNLSLFRRNRNFTFLFFGQFVSLLGTMIAGVALPYQIYTETHSTLMVGLVSLCQLIPLLFTALLGGVFADRYHRRLLLLSSELGLAICSLIFALNAAANKPSIPIIFIIAAISAAVNGLHRPALDGIVQQIVDKKDYPTVGAIGSIKSSVCMIVGPAIGGLLIAYYGIVVTYLFDFISFTFSLTALTLMTHIPKPERLEDESTLAALKKGFVYAFSRQELVGTYVIDFIAMIFGMPTALFPAIAQSLGGPKVLGLLYSAPAIGALVFSFFSGWTNRVKRHGVAIAIAAALWGVSIIFFGLATHFYIAIFFLALAGGFDAVSGIFRSIMWNESIPNHLRGRLAGIEMISYLSGPRLGDTEAGLVAAAFGITASIVSGGVLCVIGVGICCLFLPKFWHYRTALHVKIKN